MRTQQVPEDLGGGLWSVPVPIPGNPLGYTLVYALDTSKGPVLIDAGWEHLDSWQALSGGLKGLGLDVTDVYGVVVTHHHPDHSGLAGRVREASGAWIAMHAADVEMIRKFHRFRREGDREWEFAALRRAGASEAEIEEARAWRGRIDPPAIPDRELADGDRADAPGRELRVIWTPGHSPGHICLYLEDSGRLFTGDHVLPKITPNIGLHNFDEPGADPLGDFLTSLARIADVGAREALPAHEHRFTDVAGRIAAITAHHEERLGEVAGILRATQTLPARGGDPPQYSPGQRLPGGHPRASIARAAHSRPRVDRRAPSGVRASASHHVTIWEVASSMTWNVSWDRMHPMLRRLAAAEAAAHLRLLERRGMARHVPGSDPICYTAPDPGLLPN